MAVFTVITDHIAVFRIGAPHAVVPAQVQLLLGEFPHLAQAVRTAQAEEELVTPFLKRYMGACDGCATERVSEWMRLQIQGR